LSQETAAPAPTTPPCSVLRQQAGEQLAGTATQASLWLALEHPGPYPRKAVPDALSPQLTAWVADADPAIRVQLIRRPTRRGARADHAATGRPAVFVASAAGASPWLARGSIADLDEVATWSVEALLAGDLPAGLARCADELLLVCTNGRRDACCARYGRSAVDALLSQGKDCVWETTHLGGHRFAPAVLHLPSGYQFGGPTATSLTTDACRGRSGLSFDAQVAELAVLHDVGAERPAPLSVQAAADAGALVVTDANARRWSVSIATEDLDTVRPESCGKDPLPVRVRRAVAVTPLTGKHGVGITTTSEQTT
jgi:hypothetical protein